MPSSSRAILSAVAYIDDQDPTDAGWAYRLTYDDSHQESGALSCASDDRSGAASELGALIEAEGVEDGAVRWQITPVEGWYWSAV